MRKRRPWARARAACFAALAFGDGGGDGVDAQGGVDGGHHDRLMGGSRARAGVRKGRRHGRGRRARMRERAAVVTKCRCKRSKNALGKRIVMHFFQSSREK